ncbi:SDR family NAD(P)-dependent oxidoreductase [Jongsikchunia kroppenstedtii]|uniref:SDR family NAD(P)-dependent oxidoreductase n=1 Tax=Jongsikchunia kroppenstedtii TaxID=1121721 RepID=UPI000477F94A|nr:SDR family oxidoreductase [Jongsikchunia kroppenstedtii]
MTDLSGRVAVITGGGSGIGLGMAEGLAAAGADVALWARNQDRCAAAAEQLRSFGLRAEAFTCDISDEDAVREATADTLDRLGRIDILMANSGVADARPYVDTSLDDWHRVMKVNLDGTFLTTREVGRHMIERGTGGSIVLVSSLISRYGSIGFAAYGTSKTGLVGLGRSLAVEWARYGIRCNVLIPGWVETPMTDAAGYDDRFKELITRRTPVRRWGTPEEFRDVAAFLGDPQLTFHTGNEVVVDGGYAVL